MKIMKNGEIVKFLKFFPKKFFLENLITVGWENVPQIFNKFGIKKLKKADLKGLKRWELNLNFSQKRTFHFLIQLYILLQHFVLIFKLYINNTKKKIKGFLILSNQDFNQHELFFIFLDHFQAFYFKKVLIFAFFILFNVIWPISD